MKIVAFITTFFLCGCVVIPIPPKGDDMGKFGKFQLGVSYFPPKPKLDWFKEPVPELNLNNIKEGDGMEWFHPVVPQPNITLK